MRGRAEDADAAAGMFDERRMYILVPVSVMASMTSAASSASARERRNDAHIMAVRSGAGSIPASRRISHTVHAAPFTPRVSSSACTRR